jgi:hypothetical protein
MKNKKEILKEFLLEGSPEEIKIKWEIAWDIKTHFDELKVEISLERIFKPLAEKIKNLIEEPYRITQLYWGAVYVAKPSWKENDKDRGIIALCVEKWNNDDPSIGIVKNKNSWKTSVDEKVEQILSQKGLRKKSCFLGYIYLNENDRKYSKPKDYYITAVLNPDEIVDFLFEKFKNLYNLVRENSELEKLLDQLVEERKRQLRKEV